MGFGCGLLLVGWACLQRPAPLEARPVVLAGPTSSLPPERKQTISGHYRRYCSRCHGSDLKGETSQTPDFTNRYWHKRRSDAQLVVSILEGKRGEMPAFRGKLSEGEARDMVAFLREAGGIASQEDQAPADDFTRRFEELQKELQELKRQFRQLSEDED
jgi:mono/diheme cytochrome c family protein